jgi:predicted RNA-binding Zn ribbon-like protein
MVQRLRAKTQGRPLTAEALEELGPLNLLLERDEPFSRIVRNNEGHSPLSLQITRQWRTPEALLLPIAESLAQLVYEEDFTHVNACEGPACTMLFFADHTHGYTRRWCSMTICGNRAKQTIHWHRLKSADGR